MGWAQRNLSSDPWQSDRFRKGLIPSYGLGIRIGEVTAEVFHWRQEARGSEHYGPSFAASSAATARVI